MGDMKYDDATRDTLLAELDGYYKDLDGYHDALVAAHNKLVNVAWEDNEGAEGFKTAYGKWEKEFEDTHQKLERLRDAVDAAFGNAKAADNKVYNAF
ncbi:hypothetical protein [Nocardia transvalensis]|uniref:hypothetical protein n=1 Tax=Nocardia transvalensis TaxID=37333 RepID=UPI00189318E2|nr:hypothetical protein [Nocardia transvalensis]MBF6327519.1 hypothetical protein [Nocardia transvalensis]